MKAVLEFNLDDIHEQEVFRRYNKATDMASVLWDICHNRDIELCEDCKQKIRDLMCDNNVNLDEIWT